MEELKEKVIAAALKLRAVKLWDTLGDSMIFAVELPDGEIGYCCVMGNGGEHYALGFYRGQKGFSTFLRTLMMGREPLGLIESIEAPFSLGYTNCDFVNANDGELDKPTKEFIKKVAADNGLKMCRPNGWPSIINYAYGQMSLGIKDESQGADMLVALEAALDVAARTAKASSSELLEMWFGNMEYPPIEGGKTVPLLKRREDGTFEWSQIDTPAFVDIDYPEIEFTESDLASQLKKLTHKGMYQCKVIHYPATVGSKQKFFYPLIMLMAKKPTGFVLPVFPTSNAESNEAIERQMPLKMAETFLQSGVVPMSFEIDDEHTYAVIKDFCRKTGINVLKTHRLPLIEEAVMGIFRSAD